MPANKRAAPSASAPNTKKRKKGERKWYAVRVGVRPGVYDTWPECQAQTAGCRGAQYKSFLTRDEAQAFVEGRAMPSKSDTAEKSRFYAVARGSFTGIFTDWGVAEKAIVGTKGPKFKKFETREDAVAFIDLWGDEATKAKVRAEGPVLEEAEEEEDDSEDDTEILLPVKLEVSSVALQQAYTAAKVFTGDDPFLKNIYTDGSSLGNGQKGAVAGIGVYFGPKDPRNVSEPLEGEVQTNQRAELTAILRALQVTSATEGLQIVTDSRYSINCVTEWYQSWEKNNWLTKDKNEVKNKDLVQAIREEIEEREAEGTRTDLAWVKGHSNAPGNVAADKLAVAGARKARKKLTS